MQFGLRILVDILQCLKSSNLELGKVNEREAPSLKEERLIKVKVAKDISSEVLSLSHP